MVKKQRWTGWAACLSAILLLTSCIAASPLIVNIDIPGPVNNLDPQFSTDPNARMIMMNVYEGLLVERQDGTLENGVAQGYTVSGNGLAYRFALREAYWTNGDRVTAHDFAFAFRRMFGTEARSPFVADYTSLAYAQAILDGEADIASLGVEALDDTTLQITLEQPDPLFLYKLAQPAALPCNEQFYRETKGKYGLRRNILTNGPLYIHTWDNSQYILLRPSDTYQSEQPPPAGGVNFFVGRSDAAGRFLAGESDVALLGQAEYESLSSYSAEDTAYEQAVWCIAFNQNDEVWGNALLRQALAHGFEGEALREGLAPGLQATRTLVPGSMRLGGDSYRELARWVEPIRFDKTRANYLLELALQGMELGDVPDTVLYVPEEADHSTYMSLIRKEWRQNIEVNIEMEPVPMEEIEQRLKDGEYGMILTPLSPSDEQVGDLLGVFTAGSGQNVFGYKNPIYDEILEQAAAETTLEEMVAGYSHAEWRLLSDAVVIPVYTQAAYYARSSGVSGIDVYPYEGRMAFLHAVKE